MAAIAAAVAVGWTGGSRAAALPAGPWVIGVDTPLAGSEGEIGRGVRDAVRLEIDDVNANGGILGSRLGLRVYDDSGRSGAGDPSPRRGAANTRAIIADPRMVAMVGPVSSRVALMEIPLTNASDLLQCSPANTRPGLTKPRYGALDLRAAHPDRINYLRLSPSDDIQAPALAWFAFHELGAHRALVIDDAGGGRAIADGFQAAYAKLGGRTVRRALNPRTDPVPLLRPLVKPIPGVVFFGGFEYTGAAQLRLAMRKVGLGSVPLLSWDGLLDGSGAVAGSFIQQAGAASMGTFISHASMGPNTASFSQQYRSTFGSDPDEYAAAAYGCSQVIVAALRGAAADRPTSSAIREALRAYAVDPKHRYDTTLGAVGFDRNGDSTHQFVTFYRVDPSAANGAGDWTHYKEEDFGPAP